ncbi:MAG: hypothetical protein ACREFI_05055 [Stellaceae bacterium]
MKTTIEIPESLLRTARKLAAREGVTLRALIERGLRSVLAEAGASVDFKLRRASFKGNGLQAEVQDVSWEKRRARVYEGRGG